MISDVGRRLRKPTCRHVVSALASWGNWLSCHSSQVGHRTWTRVSSSMGAARRPFRGLVVLDRRGPRLSQRSTTRRRPRRGRPDRRSPRPRTGPGLRPGRRRGPSPLSHRWRRDRDGPRAIAAASTSSRLSSSSVSAPAARTWHSISSMPSLLAPMTTASARRPAGIELISRWHSWLSPSSPNRYLDRYRCALRLCAAAHAYRLC